MPACLPACLPVSLCGYACMCVSGCTLRNSAILTVCLPGSFNFISSQHSSKHEMTNFARNESHFHLRFELNVSLRKHTLTTSTLWPFSPHINCRSRQCACPFQLDRSNSEGQCACTPTLWASSFFFFFSFFFFLLFFNSSSLFFLFFSLPFFFFSFLTFCSSYFLFSSFFRSFFKIKLFLFFSFSSFSPPPPPPPPPAFPVAMFGSWHCNGLCAPVMRNSTSNSTLLFLLLFLLFSICCCF